MNANILFIDDEKRLPEYYSKKLRGQGHTVVTSRSAADALRLVDEERGNFHVYIVDIMMPSDGQTGGLENDDDTRTGLFLYRKIRDGLPRVPIVILTNRFPDELLDHDSTNDTALRVLWKPNCTPQELVDNLEELLEPEP